MDTIDHGPYLQETKQHLVLSLQDDMEGRIQGSRFWMLVTGCWIPDMGDSKLSTAN